MTSQAALRRIPRPTKILSCPQCHAPLGTNYPDCPACFDAIERYWLADWYAFLDEEEIKPNSEEERLFAQVVFDEGERHLWTVINIALTLLTCTACSSELGGGPADCAECASAWGVALWAEVVAGREGFVTPNEHALHVGRMILRHPHRQSRNIIEAWSRTVPRLLTGWLPTTESAQRYMALVKAGRLAELDEMLDELDRTINESI